MEQQSKVLSFYKLFSEDNLQIQIPIIQRDYAQGRTTEVEVRSNFLQALWGYLDENQPGRELDFVYGAISEVDGIKYFLPLDGQQRLTTLFLLHWYLAQISEAGTDFRKMLTDSQGKSKFRYETRTSSTEFCNKLIQKSIPYKEYNTDETISKIIKNEGWFYKGWEYDPTVAAMLVMLDSIEEKFHSKPEFYDRLVRMEDPVIVFQFLNLERYELTDDLYIKMNSRGKPLTPFENFKAKLEQCIVKKLDCENTPYVLHLGTKDELTSASKYFAHQIDTTWLNYFWKTGKCQPKLVDNQMMNFVRIILANYTAIHNANVTPESLKILFKSQDAENSVHYNKEFLSFYSYDALGALNPEALKGMIYSFDSLLKAAELRPDETTHCFHYSYDEVLKKVFDHSLNNTHRLLLYAFLGYLIQHPLDTSKLNAWMRVIFNLVENTRIESSIEVTNALKEVNKLLIQAPRILVHLTNSQYEIGVFYGRQLEEERIKANLILKSNNWRDKIYEAECHDLFKGQIGFLLEFSGILDYFKKNRNCEWSLTEGTDFFSKFTDYTGKAIAAFDYCKNREEGDYLWEMAVLTKGDYLIPNSVYRYHLLKKRLSDRDNSWKRLLRLNPDGQNIDLNNKRNFIKVVFDDNRFNPNDVEESCRLISNDRVTDWRSIFIQNPKLIAAAYQGFIRMPDITDIRILETSRLTYHYELRTYNLYLEKFEGKIMNPLSDTKYIRTYGTEGLSYIKIGDYIKDNLQYTFSVFYQHPGYVIQVRNTSRFNFLGCLADLEKLVREIGFTSDKEGVFTLAKGTDEDVVKVIEQLRMKLTS